MIFVNYNDLFFNGSLLKNNEISNIIMNKIDKASYSSPNSFIRKNIHSDIPKEHLSTGCKTLLNIVNNPDKCFDVIECGQNALCLLPLIKNGNILWKNSILHFIGDAECDIIINGHHFTDFRLFLSYIMEK